MVRRYDSVAEIPEPYCSSLSRFVSNLDGRTFVIQGLPQEMAGAVLARYSRASSGLRETLAGEFFDDDGEPSSVRGTDLLQRVLIQYGDDSVGELEGAHVGIEGISQLAIKTIEDKRIGGSPIEQSTRYVRYDSKDPSGRWRYLRPAEIVEAGFGPRFEKTTDAAFEVYSAAIKKLSDHIRENVYPESSHRIEIIREGQKTLVGRDELQGDDEARAFRTSYAFTLRCAALDIGRCVLPASTLTQMGLYGNGRFFTGVITALKSGELREEHERGFELEAELVKAIPTFIRRNKADSSLLARHSRMRGLASLLFSGIQPHANPVTLVRASPSYLDNVLASSFFPYTSLSLQQITDHMAELGNAQKVALFNQYVGIRTERRDRSGRGLEAGYPFTFDLVGTFGEYRDLERHRMVTQQRQPLSPDLGFVMPPELADIQLDREVERVECDMRELNSDLRTAGLATAAQYATLFNHRVRFMMGMNLRELQHLAELRTQPAGHFGYRAMVMEMARQAIARNPWITSSLEFVDYSDPGNKITRAREQARIAGKNVSQGVAGDLDLT